MAPAKPFRASDSKALGPPGASNLQAAASRIMDVCKVLEIQTRLHSVTVCALRFVLDVCGPAVDSLEVLGSSQQGHCIFIWQAPQLQKFFFLLWSALASPVVYCGDLWMVGVSIAVFSTFRLHSAKALQQSVLLGQPWPTDGCWKRILQLVLHLGDFWLVRVGAIELIKGSCRDIRDPILAVPLLHDEGCWSCSREVGVFTQAASVDFVPVRSVVL